MRILISNDDGILAPGLAALRACVADLGEITVVAPDSAQSGAGHAITVNRPLSVQEVRVEAGNRSFTGLSVDGSPADCVRLAIRNLMAEPPDIVLAGINAGANVGVNVFYSGTVAIAAEAAMFHIPGVAMSAAMSGEQPDFAAAARLCRWVLDNLLQEGLSGREVINVNIPALGPQRPAGVRVVRQSTADLEDVYRPAAESRGRRRFYLGEHYGFGPAGADTDVAALAEGHITITPLRVDMTDHSRLEALAGHRWPDMPG